MQHGHGDLRGTVLDHRYRIDEVIAHGGMATVYRGVDTRLGRPVAVKVMHTAYAGDPAFLQRFEFEARAVAGLKDPALVAVYDQGVDQGHPFLVMELVEGGTLRELLRERGPMPPHAAAAVTAPVLAALAAAHRAGLVHRDVKPENVLISRDGEVKLADFGLVRAVAAAGTTGTGVLLGTAAYLSPEQVETGFADPRSDVYATGVMLFEMLTGRPPFTADTSLAVAYRRLHEDVPAPSGRIDGVPAEIDALVAQATVRDAGQRFTDAGEMARALAAASAALALPAFQVPAPQGAGRDRRRAEPPATPASEDTPAEPAPARHTRHYTGAPDDHDPATRVGPPEAYGPAPAGDGTVPGDGRAFSPLSDRVVGQRRAARRSGWLTTVLVVVLSALLAVAGWWLGSGRYTDVPEVIGLGPDATVDVLAEHGLDGRLDGVYLDDEPTGTVLGLDPVPGTRLVRGSAVTVRHSLGRPTVPDPADDRAVDAVRAALAARTLTAEDGPAEYDRRVPEGQVLRLSPAPGTAVPVGSAVTLVLSRGAPPVPLPDVGDEKEDRARELLVDEGLRVSRVRTEFDRDVDGGRVIRTEPEAGTMVRPDAEVTLVVSNAVVVPDVVGAEPDEAKKRLADAGAIGVDARQDGKGDRIGRVGKTSPAAGDRIDPDDPQVRYFVTETVAVPGVRGTTVDTARRRIEDAGLTLKVNQLIPSDSALVITQSPAPDSRRRPGETVTVTAVP